MATGPSITVRIFGDLQGLATSLQNAGTKAQSAASTASKSFGSMLSGLNSAGVLGPFGGALSQINESIGTIIEHAHGIGPAMIGAGAAVTGVGALLTAMGSKDKAANQQLKAAIDATGGSYEQFGKQIEQTIKHQEKYGHTANESQDALRTLVTATGNTGKGLSLMGVATDLAAAKNESLTAAAGQIGKVYNGNTKLLKQFGINVAKSGSEIKAAQKATDAAGRADKAYGTAKQRLADLEAVDASKKKLSVSAAIQLRNAQDKVRVAALIAIGAHQSLNKAQDAARMSAKHQHDAVDLLGKKLAGQASAQANTFTGHIKAITAAAEDQVAKFGAKYGPALQMVGIAIMAMSTMYTTLAAAEWSSLWPILAIIAAVAAVIVVGYLLVKNWSKIWGAVQAAVVAVWDWIKTNWPMLLAILTGPIGLAVLLIQRNWDKIQAAAGAVVAWIKRTWSTIVGFFSGLVGSINNAVSGIFGGLSSAAGSVVNTIKSIWDGFVGYIAGLPGRITGAASGLFHGITDAFRTAINALIDIWNRLHFQTPTFSFFGKTTPSITVGVPSIPHLAQGGLMTRDGMVYAHAGEVISPAPASAHGPSVHVEHAHFSEALDIELFLRTAARTMQRAGV